MKDVSSLEDTKGLQQECSVTTAKMRRGAIEMLDEMLRKRRGWIEDSLSGRRRGKMETIFEGVRIFVAGQPPPAGLGIPHLPRRFISSA